MHAVKTCAALAALCLGVAAHGAELRIANGIATAEIANPGLPDITAAQPMPLPQNPQGPVVSFAPAATAWPGAPGAVAGHPGSGEESPVEVGVPRENMEPAPQEYGTPGPYTFAIPYTTSRADAKGAVTSKGYPFRAAGKLFFTDPQSGYTYVCSASLIKPGIVVTAAHCVAAFGANRIYSNWQFIPAYRSGTAPFGTWSVTQAMVPEAYLNGTDSCSAAGVVCADDVAVLALKPQLDATGKSFYAGKKTGWLSYGWNGYGYTNGNTLITQLGYPVALDGGKLMERTDSPGRVDSTSVNNTIIGSLQTGGSSGGPWVVNLGIKPTLAGISFGNDSRANTVVGVTSWGFTNPGYKIQGASPFTSDNIVKLVDAICAANAAACATP